MRLSATINGMHRRRDGNRSGFVIVAVLMVAAVMGLAAYQYSDLMAAESLAAERVRRSVEAKAAADSGIHYACALLADVEAFEGTLSKNPFDNSGSFEAVMVNESENARGQVRFSILCPDYSAGSSSGFVPTRFGVTDESGKLNLNALYALDTTGKVLFDRLMKLPNMTEAIANSIIDWIDADDTELPDGAEDSYYGSLQPSYQTKNGPFDSLEELLLVKGITPALLFGSDRNRNGRLDAGEDESQGFNAGWQAYLTVYSRERNVDATGTARVNVNGSDVAKLRTDLTNAVQAEMADFILAYRILGNNVTLPANEASLPLGQLVQMRIDSGAMPRQRVANLFALVNATITITVQAPPPPKGGPTPPPTPPIQVRSPLADQSKRGTILPLVLDKLTTSQDVEMKARVNINTAPREVLLCLPELTDAEIDLITASRPVYSGGAAPDTTYDTPAWLLTNAQIPVQKLEAIERYITARTQVYRVQSVGYFDEAGPVARVEAVIDVNQGKPRIVYYRDLTELGRSLDPRSTDR